MNVPAYRVAEEDLIDADKKTRRALGPLLDGLNRTLTLLVSSFNSSASPTSKAVSFTTANNGAAYVTLGVGAPMVDVWVTSLAPSDGSVLDTVWSMSWVATSAGAQLLFVGLAPLATYALKVRYL